MRGTGSAALRPTCATWRGLLTRHAAWAIAVPWSRWPIHCVPSWRASLALAAQWCGLRSLRRSRLTRPSCYIALMTVELAYVRRHVIEGRRIVERQQAIIDKLRAIDANMAEAERTLAVF